MTARRVTVAVRILRSWATGTVAALVTLQLRLLLLLPLAVQLLSLLQACWRHRLMRLHTHRLGLWIALRLCILGLLLLLIVAM